VIRLLARRVLFAAMVMWVVATGVFALYFVAPNNVARTIARSRAE
jgi:peptide/nickel transport system permease protein